MRNNPSEFYIAKDNDENHTSFTMCKGTTGRPGKAPPSPQPKDNLKLYEFYQTKLLQDDGVILRAGKWEIPEEDDEDVDKNNNGGNNNKADDDDEDDIDDDGYVDYNYSSRRRSKVILLDEDQFPR